MCTRDRIRILWYSSVVRDQQQKMSVALSSNEIDRIAFDVGDPNAAPNLMLGSGLPGCWQASGDEGRVA